MRTRRVLLMLAAASSFALAAVPAAAQPKPTIADQPAATLLLPYFEVDLANPAGQNTFFTVNNAVASATLTRVTVWSAFHVPVFAFDVYLTGYDAQAISVRDILNGALPQTASTGQDPADTISPGGPSSTDFNFASCNGVLPSAPVPQATINHMRAALTGQPSEVAAGQCAAIPDGSNTTIARGYITVDTVNNCSQLFPGDPGYFLFGGVGTASNRNEIWGDYVNTDHIRGREHGDGLPLVHILASNTDPQTSVPGEYTFYGRLVNWTAADNREALATQFFGRYASGGAFSSTNLTVWRDPKRPQGFFSCASTPPWYPLNLTQIIIFDEQENPEALLTGDHFAPPMPTAENPFPAGTQRVRVGSTGLPTTKAFGAVFLDLKTVVPGQTGPGDNPDYAQAFVSVHMRGAGRYSAGWPAVMVDSAMGFPTP